jgi:hypothetical protein
MYTTVERIETVSPPEVEAPDQLTHITPLRVHNAHVKRSSNCNPRLLSAAHSHPIDKHQELPNAHLYEVRVCTEQLACERASQSPQVSLYSLPLYSGAPRTIEQSYNHSYPAPPGTSHGLRLSTAKPRLPTHEAQFRALLALSQSGSLITNTGIGPTARGPTAR